MSSLLVTATFHWRFVSAGTFHIAEKGAEFNPDGSKNYVHLPQRNHKDLASRQMHVRRVPGQSARGNGKGVFYVRMKRPTSQLGETWAAASDTADTLAARQVGVRPDESPQRAARPAADARDAVASPSAVGVAPDDGEAKPTALPSEASIATHTDGHHVDASDSDAEGGPSGGWKPTRPGGSHVDALLPRPGSQGSSSSGRQDLNSAFASQVDELPV